MGKERRGGGQGEEGEVGREGGGGGQGEGGRWAVREGRWAGRGREVGS